MRKASPIIAAVVALAAAATLALAGPAAAAKYCINSPTCVTSGGIGLGSDANALANALANAQNSLGKDTVVVGPGTYSRVGGFSYLSAFPDNPLELIGAGSGQTVLANPAAAGNGSTLQVSGAGSIVRDLKTVLAPGGNNTGLGISGSNAVARNVVVAGDPATTNGTGVRVDAGAALRSASVAGTGSQLLYGISGGGRVIDTTVDTTASGYGISGPHTVQRVTVRGALVGIVNRGGTAGYKLDQVVVAVPAGALGVVASATATTSTTVTADHLTIVGDGNNTSIGASAQAIEAGPPQNAKLVLRSSIVRRVGHPLELRATNGAANIDVDHSDLNLGATKTTIVGTGSGAVANLGGNLNVDPLFASSSDRHLQPDSPAIDTGRSAVQPNESTTDRDGLPRLVGAATDMGAYEVQ
jgi:hypothetical protein